MDVIGSVRLWGAARFQIADLDYQLLIDSYDRAVFDRTGKDIRTFTQSGKLSVSGILENNANLRLRYEEIFRSSQLRSVLAEHYFFGSDASVFWSGSSWHRDQFTPFPFIKALLYLSGSFDGELEFLFYPGSHRFGDSYARELTTRIDWPTTKYIPTSESLVQLEADFFELSGVAPYVKIALRPGDVILFDSRVVHSTIATNKLRRLLATSWVGHPSIWSDNSYSPVSLVQTLRMRKSELSSIMDEKHWLLFAYRIASILVDSHFHGQDFPYAEYDEAFRNSTLGKIYPWNRFSINDYHTLQSIFFPEKVGDAIRLLNLYDF
jgi:hypothetical protein